MSVRARRKMEHHIDIAQHRGLPLDRIDRMVDRNVARRATMREADDTFATRCKVVGKITANESAGASYCQAQKVITDSSTTTVTLAIPGARVMVQICGSSTGTRSAVERVCD